MTTFRSLLSSCSFQNMIFMAFLLYLHVMNHKSKRWREMRCHIDSFEPTVLCPVFLLSLQLFSSKDTLKDRN